MRPLSLRLIVPAVCVLFLPLLLPAADSAVRAVSVRDPRIAPAVSADGFSVGAILSRDGRFVAFTSSARNLVTNDANGTKLDVFVRDRQTGTTRLVSARPDRQSSAEGNSVATSITADGRWVAFESSASDLVTAPVSGAGDVYVRDTQNDLTTLVSLKAAGIGGGDDASSLVLLTPDGRFALFESAASDLVNNDTNEALDVFLRDLQAGTTRLISVDARGIGSAVGPSGLSNLSGDATMTPDARLVAFRSFATNLVANDTNQLVGKVFVRDVPTGVTTLASVNTNGLPPGRGDCSSPLISDDGRYVVFLSAAPDLVAGVTNGWSAVFRRDLIAGTTICVSPAPQATGDEATQVDMSADGRVIAFTWWSTERGHPEVWVWEAATGSSRNVSITAQGEPADGGTDTPSLSRDGRNLAFLSAASNLVPVPTHGVFQAYVRDLTVGTTMLASLAQRNLEGSWADCVELALSEDGRVVSFAALDGGLLPQDTNHEPDVFVRDVAPDAETELVSLGLPDLGTVTGNGASSLEQSAISDDGRFVLFNSIGDDLTVGDANKAADIFLRDTVAGTNLVISLSTQSDRTANANSHDAIMTSSGRFVAFFSRATDLAPLDTNTLDDLYLRDTRQGTTTLISVNHQRTAASGASASGGTALDPTGHYVAFVSEARDLTPAAPRSRADLYLRDLSAGTTANLALVVPGVTPTSTFQPLSLTSGRLYFLHRGTNVYRYRIADQALVLLGFSTARPALSSDDTCLVLQTVQSRTLNRVSRYNLLRGREEVVAEAPGAPGFSATHWKPAISRYGWRIAFVESTGVFCVRDTNGVSDIYINDYSRPGLLTLATVNYAGTAAGNGPSDNPGLSEYGHLLVFRSAASDLVRGDYNGVPDIFVRDLRLGVTYLASVNPVTLASGNNRSAEPQISANGAYVAFTSFALDLVAGDRNPLNDVFTFEIPRDGGGDADQDSLPDNWELAYFGNLAPGAHDDSDGDGLTNLEEWLVGTVPTLESSTLRLRVEFVASEGRLRLLWPAVSGVEYRLEFKATLYETVWQRLDVVKVAEPPGEWLHVDLPLPPTPLRYFRLVRGA